MREDELTRASRREHALYGELAAVYRGILEALTDERTPVDPVRLAPEAARAEAAATNRSLVRAARARQARIAARCTTLGAGRHALAGYRPAGATTVAIDRRA